jgi:hypothetical protein
MTPSLIARYAPWPASPDTSDLQRELDPPDHELFETTTSRVEGSTWSVTTPGVKERPPLVSPILR